jgi:hypothetical protein
MTFKFALTAIALAASASTFAQTKWDLPAAYPASNFHTENLVQFAADVDKSRKTWWRNRQTRHHFIPLVVFLPLLEGAASTATPARPSVPTVSSISSLFSNRRVLRKRGFIRGGRLGLQ